MFKRVLWLGPQKKVGKGIVWLWLGPAIAYCILASGIIGL